MSLLDGQLKKQSFFDRVIDRFMNEARFLNVVLTVFFSSILLAPVVVYFSFAYFTAKVGPWWLDVITNLDFLGFFLSGSALVVFGLAKMIGNRRN
jgi:hypothetical protein